MKASRVEQAARNNAIWCDTFCRLHGSAGEFHDDVWLTRRRAPAFYPNLVTLRDVSPPTAVLENIRDLTGEGLPCDWAVKDSFQSLNLSALGFEKLFAASWIWHEFLPHLPVGSAPDLRWVPISSPAELQLWETTWSKINAVNNPAGRFLPPLLADPTVVLFAGYRDQHLIAGGIANVTDTVVGLSNVFSPPNFEALAWAGLLTRVQTVFPGKPVAGYEHGSSLAAAQTCGFEEIGRLNVWLHRA